MKKLKLVPLALSAISTFAIAQVSIDTDTRDVANQTEDRSAQFSGNSDRGNNSSNSRENTNSTNRESTYLRMFPDLPAFAPQTDETRAAVAQIGAVSGLMDAADNLSDPLQSILDQPTFSPNNLDNPDMTAGMTFVGQFLDHDITLDNRSPIDSTANPEKTVNFRTAAFDLDSVYGGGPRISPELYDLSGGAAKFKVELNPGSETVSRGNVPRYDVPRDENNAAILGDNRNDEHTILSQFHLAMLMFHNAVTDDILAEESSSILNRRQVFLEAQRIVQWHYQWIILNEYLPTTIGESRLATILQNGPQDFQPTPEESSRRENGMSGPRIPIEFVAAAYRFGHSQVRPSYRMNFGSDADSQVFSFILDIGIEPNTIDPDDFRGGTRAPRRFIDWQTFFDFGDGNVRPNKTIDTKITTNLFQLPGQVVPLAGLPADGPLSLASRNLIRHVNFGIPSGQDIARELEIEPLPASSLNELASMNMAESTPLWYYVLKEAEVQEDGRRLGDVGARIVGEVFVGLLLADSDSYLATEPDWTPTLSSETGPDNFTIVDLLNYAGVVHPLD